jgi:arylsulfatase A-like enzyme
MNVLLITMDTTRADVLSCLGGRARLTVQIDQLASRGTLFEEAYSVANTTNPSHLSILSGQRLIEHGVLNNETPIPAETVTLPLLFQARGYRTAALVSAVHVGEAAWPGFDEIQGPAGLERNAAHLVDPVVEWLEGREDGDAPFFLWAHFFDPHMIYEPPAVLARRFYSGDPSVGEGPPLSENKSFHRWRSVPRLMEWLGGIRDPDYPRAMYEAEVQYMDRQIGRLVQALDERGLRETTVIVLVADHGESLGEHGIYYDHLGLYESSLRVPFVVVVPGFPEGLRVGAPVSSLDLAPTLRELFDLGPESGGGESLVPWLMGEASQDVDRDLIFEAAYHHQVAVRNGRWKLIWPLRRTGALPGEPELFDLSKDPGELYDVFQDHPDVVERLRPKLERWFTEETPTGNGSGVSEKVRAGLEQLGYTGDD